MSGMQVLQWAIKYPEIVNSLVEKGLKFYEDHILPKKQYRAPKDEERPLFSMLAERLREAAAQTMDEKALQSLVFDVAREHNLEPKLFFSAIYQVLLGQERGPRFGSFAKLVGNDRVVELIDEHVTRKDS